MRDLGYPWEPPEDFTELLPVSCPSLVGDTLEGKAIGPCPRPSGGGLSCSNMLLCKDAALRYPPHSELMLIMCPQQLKELANASCAEGFEAEANDIQLFP